MEVRDRILRQALKEFSKSGYAGARVDRIAEKAGVNKQLIYYYFQSKENLFRSVIQSVWKAAEAIEKAPEEAGEAVRYWSRFYFKHPEWARLLIWEGLERRNRKVAGEKDRRTFWQTSLRQLERRCGPKGWPDFFDSRQYLLSLVAMEIAPLVFPQLVRLIMGRDPNDPAFLRERTKFLEEFARFVANGGSSGKAKSGNSRDGASVIGRAKA
jgi:AcrR family transcriptional regulator